MSEYLSEEEQVARLKSWWDENGTSTIVAVVVAVGAIIGWRWYGDHRETVMHEGSDAYVAYLQNEDPAAVSKIATDFEGSAYHVFVLFDQAREAVSEGDLVQAEALLESALELDAGALLGDLARIRLAQVQQGLDRSDAALTTLAQIRSEGYRAFALELKGDIHSKRGELRQAYESYQAAVNALREGENRPILTMKLNNAAPYQGEFVQVDDALSDALDAAQETLEVPGVADPTTTIDDPAAAASAVGAAVEAVEAAAEEGGAPDDGD